MTPTDDYLVRVRRGMTGMDPRVREDILRELKVHIAESAAANGGNVGMALEQMGAPVQVARGYKDLYGYGLAYQVLFLAVAVTLAIPTVPVLGVGEEGLAPYAVSVPFLAILVGWLLWAGVRAGARVGLFAGLAAAITRITTIAAVAAAQPGSIAVSGGLELFLGTSAILVVLGWLPGTAKKAWSGPKAEL